MKFRTLWSNKSLLLEALVTLIIARVLLWIWPFVRIAPHLGQLNIELIEKNQTTFEQGKQADRVCWAIEALGRRSSRLATCLVRAIAAGLCLRRRQIPYQIHFGVDQDTGSQLLAHAWLDVGGKVLTGARNFGRFKKLATFTWQLSPPVCKTTQSRTGNFVNGNLLTK